MSQNSPSSDDTSYLEKISPKDLVMFSPQTRKEIAKVIITHGQFRSHDSLLI
jgi:hypothetical protein